MVTHLISRVTSFLEQHSMIDKCNQVWAMMPPYPCFSQFNKPYSQVTQCSGKEMKALRHMIVPVFAATLSNPLARLRIPFTAALLCVKDLVNFHLMAQCGYHTETTIEYMENWLMEFRHQEDLFSRFHASKSTKMVSEALKCSLLWTNQRNRRVTPLGSIFLRMQRVIVLMKTKCRSSQTLHNILSMNLISTFWWCISWTTSVTIFASMATS